MELVKYRDWGMSTHTWFWVDKDNRVISPYFDSESQATDWFRSLVEKKEKNETEKSS